MFRDLWDGFSEIFRVIYDEISWWGLGFMLGIITLGAVLGLVPTIIICTTIGCAPW